MIDMFLFMHIEAFEYEVMRTVKKIRNGKAAKMLECDWPSGEIMDTCITKSSSCIRFDAWILAR